MTGFYFCICPVSALDLLLNPIEYKDYSLESLGQCNDQKDDGLLFE